MLYDGIQLAEGSSVANMTIDSGTTFPVNADAGELFYRTDENKAYIFNGVKWKLLRVESGADLPSNADLGDLFFKTDDQVLYVYKTIGWSNTAPQYVLQPASNTTLGGVKQGANITIAGDGTISAGNSYTLPPASASSLGGVKAGSGLSVVADGTLSVSGIPETAIADGSLLARVGSNETISGTWTFSNAVTGVDPSLSGHLATKQYVDSVASGMTPHASVKAATTANISLTGLQVIDGYTVVSGDRVLVKNQTTGTQNGVYVAAAGSWSRASDFDGIPTTEISAGDFVYVTGGSINVGTAWVIVNSGAITINNTAIQFSQISSPVGSAAAGSLTGTTLSANVINSSLTTVGTLTSLRVTGNSFVSALTADAGSSISIGPQNAPGAATSGGSVNITAGGAGFSYSDGGSVTITSTSGTPIYGNKDGLIRLAAQGGGTVDGGYVAVSTNGSDRLRVLATGAWSLGANNTATGTAGQVLTSAGPTSTPSWQNIAPTADSLAGTTLANNIVSSSLTSVGILTAGTWNATTISATKGGTGLSAFAAGDIMYASAPNTLSTLTKGQNGQVLTLANGLPTWAAPTGGSGGGSGATGGSVALSFFFGA